MQVRLKQLGTLPWAEHTRNFCVLTCKAFTYVNHQYGDMHLSGRAPHYMGFRPGHPRQNEQNARWNLERPMSNLRTAKATASPLASIEATLQP